MPVLPNGIKIAVECDGDYWHGPDQYQNDISRQKVLERCGWQFFRVRGYEYYSNREKALEPLWKLLSIKEANLEHISVIHQQEEENNAIDGHNLQVPEEEITHEDFLTVEDFYIESEQDKNWESETCFWSSTPKEGYKYAPNKGAWYIRKDNILNEDEKKEENIIRYLNLYLSGTYILTDNEPLNADFIIPIKANQKNGYLLQCYKSGHINKVYVPVLLSRKIGKEYMNGLNKNDELMYLKIIESEKIIGIYFYQKGKKIFKAHLTENISIRDQLHLQGIKVIYNDFEKAEYKIFPLEIFQDIDRLVFQSFTANGKPVDSKYYEKEWSVIHRFSSEEVCSNEPEREMISEKIQSNNVIVYPEIKLNTKVRIKYLDTGKELIVQLVDYQTKGYKASDGIQKININSPLAISIKEKTIGDKVEVGSTNNFIEITDILD